MISHQLGITPMNSHIVLDGGNVVNTSETAIVTERVFDDNPDMEADVLLEELRSLLQVRKVVAVPTIPGDITGHVDGMIRFVNERTVVLNDFSRIIPARLDRHIRNCLQNAGLSVITVPNNLHLNRSANDITGDYINFLEVGNLIVLPSYGTSLNEEVAAQYRELFPERCIEQLNVAGLTSLGGELNCVSWCRA